MPEERENDPSEMTFLEHLEEMRFVILKTLAFFSVALILVLVFFHYFNSMMLYPLNSAKNILSKWVGTEQVTEVKTERIGPVYLVSDGDEKNKTGPFFIEPKDDSIVLFKDSKPSNPWYADIKLRSMSFATPIIVYFYVGFLGALGLSLPAAFYFAARFIAPGLKKEELDVLLPGIIAAIILFAIGVCFAFFFMLPMGIAFMSWMSQGMQLEMFPDAQSYYSMVIFLTIAVGITFELPLVEFILIYVGILDVKWLENNRRMVFLIILIFATVITPPDAITQVSLTIPLYLMYEVALRLGKKMRRAKLRREAEREKLEAIEEEKERKEYAKTVAKERLAEEEAEKLEESQSEIIAEPGSEYGEIDRSHYELPEDYDPNRIDDYGMGYYEEDYRSSYIDYGTPSRPVPDFSPDWDLNRPDTSYMTPDWSLNNPPPPSNGGADTPSNGAESPSADSEAQAEKHGDTEDAGLSSESAENSEKSGTKPASEASKENGDKKEFQENPDDKK